VYRLNFQPPSTGRADEWLLPGSDGNGQSRFRPEWRLNCCLDASLTTASSSTVGRNERRESYAAASSATGSRMSARDACCAYEPLGV